MKGIFPCLGSLIMTKVEIQSLIDFYNLKEVPNDNYNDVISRNNHFNFLNNNSEIVLENVTPLTVSKLKDALGISSDNSVVNTTDKANSEPVNNETPISDDMIFSNPFFTTAKPID